MVSQKFYIFDNFLMKILQFFQIFSKITRIFHENLAKNLEK